MIPVETLRYLSQISAIIEKDFNDRRCKENVGEEKKEEDAKGEKIERERDTFEVEEKRPLIMVYWREKGKEPVMPG